MAETVLKAKAGTITSAFLCALLLCLYTLPVKAEKPVLKVCYDQWPPMTIFPTTKEPRRGVVIDMLADIYTKAGYKLQYFPVPLARAMAMVETGLCDMLPEVEFSADTKRNFVYAEQATFTYPSAFVIRRNDPWRYAGVNSIIGKRIATGPGWNYRSMSKPYQNQIEHPDNSTSIKIIAGDDDVVTRIFKMIAANRVDIYADNLFVLNYLLNSTNLHNQLQIVTPGLENPLTEKPVFSVKIPQLKRQKLIRIWDQGRKNIQPQQEDEYLKRYGLKLINMY